MRQRRMQAAACDAGRVNQGEGGEKENGLMERELGIEEGCYRRQKRRRAQPATMPETAGPPKPKADFPATNFTTQVSTYIQHWQDVSGRCPGWVVPLNIGLVFDDNLSQP